MSGLSLALTGLEPLAGQQLAPYAHRAASGAALSVLRVGGLGMRSFWADLPPLRRRRGLVTRTFRVDNLTAPVWVRCQNTSPPALP